MFAVIFRGALFACCIYLWIVGWTPFYPLWAQVGFTVIVLWFFVEEVIKYKKKRKEQQ